MDQSYPTIKEQLDWLHLSNVPYNAHRRLKCYQFSVSHEAFIAVCPALDRDAHRKINVFTLTWDGEPNKYIFAYTLTLKGCHLLQNVIRAGDNRIIYITLTQNDKYHLLVEEYVPRLKEFKTIGSCEREFPDRITTYAQQVDYLQNFKYSEQLNGLVNYADRRSTYITLGMLQKPAVQPTDEVIDQTLVQDVIREIVQQGADVAHESTQPEPQEPKEETMQEANTLKPLELSEELKSGLELHLQSLAGQLRVVEDQLEELRLKRTALRETFNLLEDKVQKVKALLTN